MKLSPFTPIFFEPRKGRNGVPSNYIQTFAPSDQIMLQFIGVTGDAPPTTRVIDAYDDSVLYTIEWSLWQMNPNDLLYFAVITGLSCGHYYITIDGIGTSEPFKVTDYEPELNQTTLIQYAMKDNKQRDDAVFLIDNMPTFFDFRVPGGFKDGGWQFSVENEQFVTEDANIVELYGMESTAKTFTMGEGDGVPIWFAELLNRLLTCHYVYFDGERYARKESNVPEITANDDLLNSFIITQVVQKVTLLNPTIEQSNHIAMRRIDSDYYRTSDINNENINRLIR
jgi:hypothetical protein